MLNKTNRPVTRKLRHDRLRRNLKGTAKCPRLSVFKSHKNYYLQIIDDETGKTLVSASTQESEFRTANPARGNLAAAKAIGGSIAQRAKTQGIERVVFDRGGNKYMGAVKALADAAREAGLKF